MEMQAQYYTLPNAQVPPGSVMSLHPCGPRVSLVARALRPVFSQIQSPKDQSSMMMLAVGHKRTGKLNDNDLTV